MTRSRRVQQQRSLKSQLADQVNIVTRRCAVQEQAATRWRVIRAEIAAQERRVHDLHRRISSITAYIADRNLSKPALLALPDINGAKMAIQQRITRVEQEQNAVNQRSVAARRVLVTEAASLLGLKPGGIAGLPLPTPGEIKRESFRIQNIGRHACQSKHMHTPRTGSSHAVHDTLIVNAALQHTCHLLDLLTRYLFVALPFEPVLSPDARKGRLAMKPNIPFIHTTKFRDKSNTLWFGRKHLAASYTSFALLAHSVAYLAWTQGVDGVEEADITANLVALVQSPLLGEKAHLGRMRSLGFSLDVNDVVGRILEEAGVQGEEGWALVDG